MENQKYSVITGTGSYIPEKVVTNKDFIDSEFLTPDGAKFEKPNEEIVEKLEEITGISERRYVDDNLVTSDIGLIAAERAIESANIDKEDLDYIIFAHNFGDIKANNKRSEFVPSLAARIKHKLGIANPKAIAYDIPFGCPGWLQGIIQANYYLRSGDATKILVIGAETLSRISDPHDRDSMIYSDGAGATVIEAKESEKPVGILSHSMRSDTLDHAYMLWMDESYSSKRNGKELFLKMNGHKLYQYALTYVPLVVKECLEKAKLHLKDVTNVLIHQANAKMDEAILKRIYKLYGLKDIPAYVMPMIIAKLGNSSVATLPTLLDMLLNNKIKNYTSNGNDLLLFASVGAGMNINSVAYRAPGA